MSNPQTTECVHHKVPFTYFCDSCQEPVCHQCTTLGPHNFNLHVITQLQQAFKMRVEHISQEIEHNLLPKREEILAQIHRIEYRIQEIKYMAFVIERDCRAEMNGILDRLKQAEGLKQAKLQHQVQIVQQDLDEMNDLVVQFYELSKQQDLLEFLLQSAAMLEKVEFLIAKPYNKVIAETGDDLPRELTERRIQLGRIEGQKKLLDQFHEIIWRMMNEKKYEEELLKANLNSFVEKEIREWSKLVDFFAEQLKEMQQVCYFCNSELSAESVNKLCKMNKRASETGGGGYTKEKPNDSQTGNGRHFFGHSVEGKKMPTLNAEAQKSLPTGVMIEAIISKVRIRLQNSKLDLEALFEEHDTEKSGFVNPIVFNYILQEQLNLVDEEIESLTRFMEGRLNYNVLLGMIRSNRQIQAMEGDLVQKYKSRKKEKVK